MSKYYTLECAPEYKQLIKARNHAYIGYDQSYSNDIHISS
ncbi:hypothetical protein CASFOL_017830 [Castilleja foliolosa]|uniref:Uncharacterized protein n=1 Tax=Castilleja foliolosa TaxID=1961234 RepID=A0ABD3D9B7_9LAMI